MSGVAGGGQLPVILDCIGRFVYWEGSKKIVHCSVLGCCVLSILLFGVTVLEDNELDTGADFVIEPWVAAWECLVFAWEYWEHCEVEVVSDSRLSYRIFDWFMNFEALDDFEGHEKVRTLHEVGV